MTDDTQDSATALTGGLTFNQPIYWGKDEMNSSAM